MVDKGQGGTHYLEANLVGFIFSRAERWRLSDETDERRVPYDRSQAFAPQTVNSYSPRVEYHVQKMIAILERLGGKEANAVNICSNLAFDMYACQSSMY